MKRMKRLAVACGFALVVGTSMSAVPAGAQTAGDLSAVCQDSSPTPGADESGSVLILFTANTDLTITSATVSIDGGAPQALSFNPTTVPSGTTSQADASGGSGFTLAVTVNVDLGETNASIQEDFANPCGFVDLMLDITAEGECAPDASTQGVSLTFINNGPRLVMGQTVTQVMITSASYEGPGSEGGSLSFSPTSVEAGETATASLSISGQSAGTMAVALEYLYIDAPATLSVEFDVTACTTAAPEAIQQAPSFTG